MLSRLIAFAFGLLLALTPARSQLIISELHGFNAGGAALPSYSFRGCTASTTDATTYTHTSVDIGTDTGSSRTIVVATGSGDTQATFSVSTLTVGGVTATSAVQSSSANSELSTLYYVTGVSGATGDIVVTHSETVTSNQVCVWALYDLNSSAPSATNSSTGTSGAALTLSVNTQAAGVTVGMCSNRSSGQTFTWTGLTESSDASDGSEQTYSSADLLISSASTPLSITCDPTGTASDTGVAASFR